ncbi:MAG: hypothetical protein Q9191_004900 [Dirinaria sp. TL-2023a]
MASVYRNSSSLSFDSFVHDLDAAFGMSTGGLGILFDTSSGKCLSRQTDSIYGAQLHPEQFLKDLTMRFVKRIQERLAGNQATTTAERTVSLFDWCTDVLVPAASEGFFGPAILELNPNFVEDFLRFDENSWILTYRYPRFLAHKFYQSLDRNTVAFMRYLKVPNTERRSACYHVHTTEAKLRQAGLVDRDIAIVLQMFHWVTNANAYKVPFWLLAYLLHSPVTLDTIRTEVARCIDNQHVAIDALLQSFPLLNASFTETLRLVTAASSARTVLSPTEIGGKVLQEGKKLLLPYRQLHFQESTFGPLSVDEFHPERFVAKEDLDKGMNFKPFGGGVTYCSGRFLARREVLAFVALVIRKYDLEIVREEGGKGGVPRQDQQKPTLGVLESVKGDHLFVRLKQRTDLKLGSLKKFV